MLPRILRTSIRTGARTRTTRTRNVRASSLTLSWKRFYAEPDKAPTSSGSSNSVNLTIATPNAVFIQSTLVDAVILPGLEGDFEVDPNLVPVISELRPGVVTVVKKGGERTRYFISAGFAFVHEDSSCSVNPVECVNVDDLDVDAARAALAEAQQKLASATNEQEKAIAQISAETAEAVLKVAGNK